MFNPISKWNVRVGFTFTDPKLLCYRMPKRVVQNKKNCHKNPDDSHNYHGEI